MTRKRRPKIWIFATALVALSLSLSSFIYWYRYVREAPSADADGKIAVLISNSDELSFYVSLEARAEQRKEVLAILQSLVREDLAAYGCGPFDEENLEEAPSESHPGRTTIAYAAFHCESEPFEDLAYEVELKPFQAFFRLTSVGRLALSVARINQADDDVSCFVEEQPDAGCEISIGRGEPFPSRLSIKLHEGEPFAMKARSRKPIDIACEQLSSEQLIGERFIDLQHLMSEQTHIMRDEGLSMKHARVCQQLLVFSLRRDAETGLDTIQDALLLPSLRDTQTLADNCWDNPEGIPVPGMLGIIEAGQDEKILPAQQAWDLALASGQLFAVNHQVFCRETLPPDRDDIWGSVRSVPLHSHLQVARKTEKLPAELQAEKAKKAVKVWELDLDGDRKKDYIAQLGEGSEAKTCVYSHEGRQRSCSWPRAESLEEDSARYLWFAQLDADPFLEVLEMSSAETSSQRLYKIDPKTWALKKLFDFNPLIDGNYKDRKGIFFGYASDINDIAMNQGQLSASFYPELYEGQERPGPFLMFRGVPSQGNQLEVPDLMPMRLEEIQKKDAEALAKKLYEADSGAL